MEWTSVRGQRAMKLMGVALVVVVAAAVAYLGPGLARTHSPGTVLITVDHPTGLIDTGVTVTVTGLQAHQRALVRARTVDSRDRGWSSFAVFEADGTGTIDLRTSTPLAGSYDIADPMGLFWSMAGPTGAERPVLLPRTYDPPESGELVTLSVELSGKTLSSRNLSREVRTKQVAEHHLALSEEGFIGTYFAQPNRAGKRTAVLLFGGSGGGQTRDLEASLLASHGYPALSIAYFGEPGLPRELADIPLEYFVKALTWLRAQPEVNPQRVLVSGVSRGSEAAQLLGVYAANLVHGVIALVPSNVAICAYPGCDGPAWTLGGKALPYTRQFDQPAPTDDPAAVIPVERIQGPIFLACGGKDIVWVSCVYANAIVSRLEARGHAYRHLLLSYPDAGHGMGSLLPYLSGVGRSDRDSAIASDQLARVNAWPQLLRFIAQA